MLDHGFLMRRKGIPLFSLHPNIHDESFRVIFYCIAVLFEALKARHEHSPGRQPWEDKTLAINPLSPRERARVRELL